MKSVFGFRVQLGNPDLTAAKETNLPPKGRARSEHCWYTAISRKVVGKSARDHSDRYCVRNKTQTAVINMSNLRSIV